MPWRRATWLLAVLVLVSACGTTSAATDPTLVRTAAGDLRGTQDGDVLRFRGIPYAEPPTGAARWTPPRPARSWTGVRVADRSGLPCTQSGLPPQGTSEDCLYLDVTTPAEPSESRRPVMVWLHGGGFSSGAGSEYDARRLSAQGDVVVVTVDFRLGVFGNLALPGMADGGSYGLQDQQAALAWVKQNAAAFGGDPRNVTLFGQSGGAVAMCGQLTSPKARGLFEKAILQSGSCGTTLGRNASGPDTPAFGTFWEPMALAEQTGAKVAADLGCADRTTALACLRELPVDRLLTQNNAVTGAAVGGATLPVDPNDALRAGRIADVPVLSGHTADEQRIVAGTYALLGRPITAEQYPALLAQGFGADATAVEAEYPLTDHPSPAAAWAAAYTDSGFVCPQLDADAALAEHGRVYGYEFADRTAPPLIPAVPGFDPGASHASELFYLFDLPGKPLKIDGSTYSLTPTQKRVAAKMITAWSDFARTGKPGNWPVWHGRSAPVHVLTADADHPAVAEPFTEHHCGFWAAHR